MTTPEVTDGPWAAILATLGGGGGAGIMLKTLMGFNGRLKGLESKQESCLGRMSEVGKLSTAVGVLSERTEGLGTQIDIMQKGQDRLLDHLLDGKG